MISFSAMASDDGRSSHTGQLSDYPEPNTPKDMVEENFNIDEQKFPVLLREMH